MQRSVVTQARIVGYSETADVTGYAGWDPLGLGADPKALSW